MSKTLRLYFWIVLFIYLAGCGPIAPIAAPTKVDSNAVFTHTAPTVDVQLTQPATSQPTATLTPTSSSTDTPIPTATSSPAETPEPTEPVVTVPGLRMAYIINGNLYVQDSGCPPLQLTHSGADSGPSLSDDGQKLVFFRSENPGDVQNGRAFSLFSINADGSQERVRVVPELLTVIDSKYNKSSEVFSRFFMPGTHRMLFNTRQVSSNGRYSDMGTNEDLLLVDADSGKTRQILAPGQVKGFVLSPNGEWLAIWKPDGQIDVIGVDGKIFQQNLTARFLNDLEGMPPGYVEISWTADSKRLNIVPGDPFDLPRMGRVVWQYSMADGSVAKTNFDPPPVTNMFAISPDGNWVVYTYNSAMQGDEARFGVYLGNLRTSAVRKLGSREVYGTPDEYDWSPDNAHFYFSSSILNNLGFIGDNRGNVEPSCDYSFFVDWIDNRRYICDPVAMGEVGKAERELIIEPPPPSDFVWGRSELFDFVMLK